MTKWGTLSRFAQVTLVPLEIMMLPGWNWRAFKSIGISLPPLLIHVGSRELLLSDSTRLARRAEEAGVKVTLRVWDGLFHVFHTAGFLPESRRALAEIGAFAKAGMEGAS